MRTSAPTVVRKALNTNVSFRDVQEPQQSLRRFMGVFLQRDLDALGAVKTWLAAEARR